MKLKAFLTVLSLAALILPFCGETRAQPGGPGTPGTPTTPGPGENPIEVDPGSIGNGPINSAYVMNAWTARAGDRAIVVAVYSDLGGLQAKVRQYQKDLVAGAYQSRKTKISRGTTLVGEFDFITVSLVLETAPGCAENTYRMEYQPQPATEPKIELGWIRFVQGRHTRKSSSVVVRLKRENVDNPNVTLAVGGPNLEDERFVVGCDEPPIDDIGEEEEIARGVASMTNYTPGGSIALANAVP